MLTKEEEIDGKLTEMSRREQGLADRETHLRQLQEEHKDAREQQFAELERISGMTVNEAKLSLLERSEDLVRHEARATCPPARRKRPAPKPKRRAAISSPTPSSVWQRVTPPRRPCPSSSSLPTT